MSGVACSACGYSNDPDARACNLCGAVLVAKAKPKASSPGRATTKLDAKLLKARTQRLERGGAGPAEATPSGLKRLQEARSRVTSRLQRLSEVQDEAVPVLQAQIQAEQEERALAQDIDAARARLLEGQEELKESEGRLRGLRKQVAALSFELRKRVEERAALAREEEQLEEQLERLEAIRAELQGEGPPPDVVTALELKGLQGVCRRLSERVATLGLQLQDRDSCLHWLMSADDPAREEQNRQASQEALDAILGDDDEAADLRRWLEPTPAPLPSDVG
jgi:chromosome segregation ATPase